MNEINSIETHDPPEKSALKEDLIIEPQRYSVNKKTSCCRNFCAIIFPCFKRVDITSRRIVYFNNPALNITNWENKEENNKYNLITCVPLVLFNQFKQFGNFFYLLMSIAQFFPDLKVGYLFTYISPLSFVVCVSMAKELYDDINRRIQDKKTNSAKINVLVPSPDKTNFEYLSKSASDLLVGDIIE